MLEEGPQKRTQCLGLNNKMSEAVNCQSEYIPIAKNGLYLQSGRIKNLSGNALFGRAWFDQDKNRIVYDYVDRNSDLSQWKYYSQVIKPPANAAYCLLWLTNYKTKNPVYFDDVLFIKLLFPLELGLSRK